MKKELLLANFNIIIILFFYISLSNNGTFFYYDEYYYLNFLKKSNIDLFDYKFNFNIIGTNLINFNYFIKIITIILFFLNTFLINIILKKLNLNFSMLIFIILSPVFLYTHLIFNSFIIPLFFYLISINFLLKDNYIASTILFLITLIFNPLFFYIIIISLALYYGLFEKKIFIPLVVILITTYLFSLIKKKENILIISDFGSNFGVSIFLILLAIIGLLFYLKQKNKNFLLLFILLSIINVSFYEPNYVIFLSFIITYFASISYEKLINSEWESDILKNYVIILIICGLIFSSLSFLNNLKKEMPKPIEIDSIRWLKNYQITKINNLDLSLNKELNKEYLVLSHYELGYLLKYYELNPFLDKNYYKYSTRNKINETEKILKSRNLKEVISFLKENNIKYIIINKELQNIIGKKEDDGILLLLKNSKNFKEIYKYNDINIWEVLY